MPATLYTVQNLIDEALQVLGVLEPGNTMSSAQYADCLRTLNFLQDEWNTQEGLQPSIVAPVFNLVAGKAAYAIGPTAVSPDFVAQFRPQNLIEVSVYWGSGSSQVRIPVHIETIIEASARPVVNLTGQPYPTKVYLSDQVDNNGSKFLVFWPTPTQALPVELVYAPAMFDNGAVLSGTVFLPSGYLRAYVYNLAVALAPKFGKAPSMDLITQAATALRNLRNRTLSNRPIHRSRESKTGGVYWNWISGDNEAVS
jgi:hypothetical protein